jgi:hypothetical protein
MLEKWTLLSVDIAGKSAGRQRKAGPQPYLGRGHSEHAHSATRMREAAEGLRVTA